MRRRTALVTGASAGFGWELARLLARDGFDVGLVARRGARLEELAQELEERYRVSAHVVQRDLSSPGAADAVADALRDRDVTVDVLVNAAGLARFGPFLDGDPRDEAEMVQVNVAALTRLTKLFVPGMVERRWGRVLNVASNAAFLPGPLMAVYGSTKAFVLALSVALHEELRGTGVAVTAFCPGPTDAVVDLTGEGVVWPNGRRGVAVEEGALAAYEAMKRGKPIAVDATQRRLENLAGKLAPRTLGARFARRVLWSG